MWRKVRKVHQWIKKRSYREWVAAGAAGVLVIAYSFIALISVIAALMKPLPTSLLELLKMWVSPLAPLVMAALRYLWGRQREEGEEGEQGGR